MTASSQAILSIQKADNRVLIQDKEMSVTLWTYEKSETPNTSVTLKEFACLKRSEPKASFCKCLVFQSDLEYRFNKYGNVINDENISIEKLSINNSVNKFYITMPYESKEITTFSVETRKKVTVLDITKDSPYKIGDVVMCMKFIQVSGEPYLIICTEEGHVTLYNIKCKRKESQVELKSNIVPPSCGESEAEQLKDKLLSNTPDTPMAIDFDPNTMRGIVGTSSSNLFCIKLYLGNSISNENTSTRELLNKNMSYSRSSNEAHSENSAKHDESGCTISKNASPTDSLEFQNAILKMKMVVELKHSGVSCISIKPDGKLFVLSHWNGNGIFIYSWRNMKCISYVDYVYRTINDLYFYNNNTLAVACDKGKVSLWTFS